MYLSRLLIKNFRSIKLLNLDFSRGKNILVGKNNAGKSNIIKAVNLVLGENSPDYKKSDNITEDDYFAEHGEPTNEILIWAELTREKNEVLDFESLYGSCSGYFVSSDSNRNPHRYKIDCLSENISDLFLKTKNNWAKWIDANDIAKGDLDKNLNPMFQFAYAFKAVITDAGIEKELRFFYRENETAGWVMSFYSPFRNILMQSALIPSFRDPQSQLRINNWTWYGKLLKAVTSGSKYEAELNSAMDSVSAVSNKIFSEVGKKVTASSIKTTFPGTALSFQFNTETKTDLYKSCVIYIDDGFKTQLTEKGSGIQSSVIVGLFSYYMREINVKGSALLCIEEPELFLHPHGRRVMNNNLEIFMDDDRNQVILSTHSPEFINMPGENNIILVRKLDGETKAVNVNTRKFKSILLDNDQNELFFADKVIVCEGFDKYILRWVSDYLFPGKLDELNVSIIQVNGKDSFSKMVKLLMALNIECYVLADFDYLLRDKDNAGKAFGPLHESVLNLPSRFFFEDYIFGDSESKIQSRLDKWRNEIKNQNLELFYTAKKSLEIPDELSRENIDGLLQELRTHGICVLSGEIEDLFTSNSGFSNKKLSYDEIYKLKSQLDSGVSLKDLIDTSELSDFLSYVFGEDNDSDEKEMLMDGLDIEDSEGCEFLIQPWDENVPEEPPGFWDDIENENDDNIPF